MNNIERNTNEQKGVHTDSDTVISVNTKNILESIHNRLCCLEEFSQRVENIKVAVCGREDSDVKQMKSEKSSPYNLINNLQDVEGRLYNISSKMLTNIDILEHVLSVENVFAILEKAGNR